MSKLKFETEVIPEFRGRGKSKWDELLPHLDAPGKTLFFDPEEVTKQNAATAAQRMRVLDSSRDFHSGYDVLKKKTFVRVRPEGELPSKDEDEDKEEDKKEEVKIVKADPENATPLPPRSAVVEPAKKSLLERLSDDD